MKPRGPAPSWSTPEIVAALAEVAERGGVKVGGSYKLVEHQGKLGRCERYLTVKALEPYSAVTAVAVKLGGAPTARSVAVISHNQATRRRVRLRLDIFLMRMRTAARE